jgi:ankyrin repeat protein
MGSSIGLFFIIIFRWLSNCYKKELTLIKKNSRDGNTPIYASMGWNNKSMTDYLIKNGADLNVKNDSGLTPIEYAKRR